MRIIIDGNGASLNRIKRRIEIRRFRERIALYDFVKNAILQNINFKKP